MERFVRMSDFSNSVIKAPLTFGHYLTFKIKNNELTKRTSGSNAIFNGKGGVEIS
jgi:hypothetical protein